MVKGQDPVTGNFKIKLRHPRDNNVKGRPRVLVAQIIENLRNALDYMVFQLSALNEPNLNHRVPQFVIASSEGDFERQARTRLRYLTDEQRSLVERLQPYHGNGLLTLLGKLAIAGKHRHLLSIHDCTGLDIHFAEIAKKDQYESYFMYPVQQGLAVFARPQGRTTILLMEKYDALVELRAMIDHTADVIRASYCFFEGRPLDLTIVKE